MDRRNGIRVIAVSALLLAVLGGLVIVIETTRPLPMPSSAKASPPSIEPRKPVLRFVEVITEDELPHLRNDILREGERLAAALHVLASTVPGSHGEHFALNRIEEALQPFTDRLKRFENGTFQRFGVEELARAEELDEKFIEESFGYLLPPNPPLTMEDLIEEIEVRSASPSVRRLDGNRIIPQDGWESFLLSRGWPRGEVTAEELLLLFIRYQLALEECGVLEKRPQDQGAL